jgi:hypothetical protein
MATAEARHRGQRKAAARVSVHTYADEPVGPGKDWHKEQKKRLEQEISALEKELKDFNPQEAAAKVRQALELELRRKRLRLEECALEL